MFQNSQTSPFFTVFLSSVRLLSSSPSVLPSFFPYCPSVRPLFSLLSFPIFRLGSRSVPSVSPEPLHIRPASRFYHRASVPSHTNTHAHTHTSRCVPIVSPSVYPLSPLCRRRARRVCVNACLCMLVCGDVCVSVLCLAPPAAERGLPPEPAPGPSAAHVH